ncbi:hypothetical protein K504DRAFT_459529 [Pleomassaria siparia CBS 279.74]|uniref:C4-dicarboxylate transporter/malic acid transport protein n=1 Tax=Pleomassaria siparia CBS 279.74 TaxID=1314801 RepID=A0A6G1K192_9PLEO|nr:hypothetical protein K504DRAFT_459529 [Pleomassaria siparia CBS 279.74]
MRFNDSSRIQPRPRGAVDPDASEAEKQDDTPPSEVSLRERIAHFTWPWFATTMSTGAVAVVVGQTPNRFPGLQTIGEIFFVLDVVLFVLFTGLMMTRFVLVPAKLSASLHHPVEGLFFGSFWVSISLIICCAQTYGVPNSGPWLVKALEICFWVYCAVVFVVAVGQYFILFHLERLNVAEAMPAWIFPIYPLLVVGPMAGAMIPSQPLDAAWNMWIGAVMFQGLGWTVAVMMYAIYIQRLMGSRLPDPPVRPGMYVSVGPAGYTAAGLISLATRAPNVFAGSKLTTDNTALNGNIIREIGILAGLFLILFAYWFFFLSSVAVASGFRKMTFTLNWWAFVFPNAGLTLATIQAGIVLKSPGINGVASALTVMLVMLWLVIAPIHVRAVWQGEILWPGKDEDKTMKDMPWGRWARVPAGLVV